MAKKRPGREGVREKRPSTDQPVVQPHYYQEFRCIGPDCEDSCCIGWRVDIDRATWQRYQVCQSEVLAPMFRDVLELEPRHDLRSSGRYATVRLTPGRRCPFLQDDMLCLIQSELGATALSDVCASFPRHVNVFGQQREYGLGLACPEAARVVLLHREPTALIMAAPDGSLAARDYTSAKIPVEAKNVAILNQLRVLIFRILQWRELALGARVMLLGSLLDELSQVRGKPRFKSFSEFLPVMETYAALFADPSFIEAEFAQLAGNLPRKLQCTTGFLADFLTSAEPRFKESILAFVDGLLGGQVDDTERDMASMLAHYERIYGDFYLPYFRDKCYVLENYLVNDALVSMFPFNRRTYLDAYRVMVFNLAIIQVMLVGIAGHYQGLTDDRVVQFIQTFTRRSAHNSSYLGKLTEAIASKDSPSFVEVMWMLKER